MNEELLKKAINCLSINDIYLHESNINIEESFDPIQPGFDNLDVQFRHGVKKAQILEVSTGEDNLIKILKVFFSVGFRILPPDLEKEPQDDVEKMNAQVLAEVSAVFTADYYLDCEETELDKDAIDVFVQNNVGYHVWPYWREYVHSVSDRVRLPRVTVPLYKIPK